MYIQIIGYFLKVAEETVSSGCLQRGRELRMTFTEYSCTFGTLNHMLVLPIQTLKKKNSFMNLELKKKRRGDRFLLLKSGSNREFN